MKTLFILTSMLFATVSHADPIDAAIELGVVKLQQKQESTKADQISALLLMR